MIDVLLVDDHPVMRQLLRELLETYPDLTIVGEAKNGEDAVAQATTMHPSVAIIDIHLPTMNGIEATQLIKSKSPYTTVIGLTAGEPGHSEHDMISAGAAAVINKEEVVDALYPSIVDALRSAKNTGLGSTSTSPKAVF